MIRVVIFQIGVPICHCCWVLGRFIITCPFHTLNDGTSLPSAIFKILDDGSSANNQLFDIRYIFSSMVLASAPSSNMLRNLTVSPFGPLSSTPCMKGMLVSPGSFFFWLPMVYRSKTLSFHLTLYIDFVVSGITTMQFVKAPSSLFGVYSPLVGLTLSISIGSSYLGAVVSLFSNLGVIDKVLHFTLMTLPLFPGQ